MKNESKNEYESTNVIIFEFGTSFCTESREPFHIEIDFIKNKFKKKINFP